MPLCSIGGNHVLLVVVIKDFKVDHQSFEERDFEVSFAAMLS